MIGSTSFTIENTGPGALSVRCVDLRGQQQGPLTIVAPKEKASIELDSTGATIQVELMEPQ